MNEEDNALYIDHGGNIPKANAQQPIEKPREIKINATKEPDETEIQVNEETMEAEIAQAETPAAEAPAQEENNTTPEIKPETETEPETEQAPVDILDDIQKKTMSYPLPTPEVGNMAPLQPNQEQ